MMAAIKTGILDIAQGFIDIGQSPTFATATTFTTPTNDLSYMGVGTRLRFNVGSSTLYGTVVSASFSTNTGINVALDSGSLTASLSSMAIGITAIRGGHFDVPVSISSTAVSALLTLTNTHTASGIQLKCSAGAKFIQVSNASNFQVVNSANTIAIMTLTDAGAATFVGNVTAFSDERLKKNWKPLSDDIIEQIASIEKVGTFERVDMPGVFVGIGAQSLLQPMPAAVNRDHDYLAVDYGPAAMALCAKLCREVVALRNRVDELENKQ